MVGMFCSLKEAAERLRVSEGEIEAMLEQGALREFREGPCRLVKASDVGVLAQSLVGSRPSSVGLADDSARATGIRVPQSDRRDSGPVSEREPLGAASAWSAAARRGCASESLGSPDDREGVPGRPQTKLPHRAAATPSTTRPRNTGRAQPQRMSSRAVRWDSPAPSGRVHGRTVRPARRTDAPTQQQSVRQWFWNGLTQDRPVTIAILFGLVLLVLSALLAGVRVLGPLVVRGYAP